jgi:hypothetical protein
MLSMARPYSLHVVTETSTGLCLMDRWYLAGASQGSPRTEMDAPPLFNHALDPPHRVEGHRQRADQLVRLPQH